MVLSWLWDVPHWDILAGSPLQLSGVLALGTCLLPVPCPENSGSCGLPSSIYAIQGVCGLPLHFPSLCCAAWDSVKTASWDFPRVLCTSFSSFKVTTLQCLMPIVLKTVISCIFPIFLVVSGKQVNIAPVTQSWPEA